MTIAITLDCDWAPDFVIEAVAKTLTEKNIKATYFITNESASLKKLEKNPLFELGIHPNFSTGSTQGKDLESILTTLKKIVPKAKSVRTHSLIQSSPILEKFHKFGIKNDVSLLLPKTPNIIPHYLKHIHLLRLPYFWEDDLEMCEGTNCWSIQDPVYHNEGLKIFDFHPIHIYLNSSTLENYKLILDTIRFENLNEQNIRKFINKKNSGTKTFFNQIINFLANKYTYTIEMLSEKYHSSMEI